MEQEIEARNITDVNGNPVGGYVKGLGIDIQWQDGPLGTDCCNRRDKNETHAPGCDSVEKPREPNGAFVEGVLDALIARMRFYQTANQGRYSCRENSIALQNLETAQLWLEKRTSNRKARGVEGVNVP